VSTTPTTPTPTAAPDSALDKILKILDLGLKSAGALTGGPLGAGFNLADGLLLIGVHAKAVYEAEVGQPYDLSKVPPQERV
jgi:hypothetical protein